MIVCINKNHPEVKQVADKLGLPPYLIAAKFSVWQSKNNNYDRFPTLNELVNSNEVLASAKIIDIISKNIDRISKLNKTLKGDQFWNKIQKDFQIPKEQLNLLKESEGNTLEEKLLNFAANYSYTIEINTAKEISKYSKTTTIEGEFFYNGATYEDRMWDGYFKNKIKISQEEFQKASKEYHSKRDTETQPTQHYSNLTVPGGTNYTEQEIATPAITPSIKGHAQFATDKGIGWFRSDDKTVVETPETVEDELDLWTAKKVGNNIIVPTNKSTKTRRILEVQSDLFQKGRERIDLTSYDLKVGDTFETDKGLIEVTDILEGSQTINIKNLTTGTSQYLDRDAFITAYKNKIGRSPVSKNEFLQLLNKDNNWVTFFVKSIIQDTAKKGYEKVLFPTGNIASKVEGHSTLEEFKKQKEDRIKELEIGVSNRLVEAKEKDINEQDLRKKGDAIKYAESINRAAINEINQLKQELERVEKEGFAALRPIYNFYENTVTNILKKQGYNPALITDEYGNTWQEITIKESDSGPIFYQSQSALSEEQKFAQRWNIKTNGYSQGNTLATPQMINEARALGLGVKNAQYGGYHLTKDGKFFNPFRNKYQSTSQFQEQADTNLDSIIKEYLDSIGVTVEELDEITDSQGNPLNVIARAKLLNNLVEVVKGKAKIDTLSEEAAHFAFRLLGKDNPLYQKMMKDITNYEIYKSTLVEYSSFPAYQNEDGTPNIDKIKEEAVGKLIANHIVKQFKGEETDTNLDKATRWFDKFLNVLKRVLRNVGLTKLSEAIKIADNKVSNPYKDIASEILSGKTSKKNNQVLEDSEFYQAEQVSQKTLLTSIQELQSKIIKDETGAKGERYEVLGEKGYKSPTEMVEDDYNKRFAGSTQTKEDIEKNEREREIGLLKHAITSELIREAFPNENKHLKPINSKYSNNPIYSILKSKLNTRSSDPGIETIADIIAEAKKDGSIVLSEVMVANTVSKRAGTIDILIIRKDGTLDIYDVKPGSKTGIHKNKMKGYNLQINEYVKILEKGDPKLGILPSKVAKKRIIPISNTYTVQEDKINNTKKYFLKSFEYNSSIPTGLEKTGIVKIDEMIDNFRTQIEILERKLTKQTDEKEKEKIKDFISTRETYIANLQKQRTLASILPSIQRDLLIIEDLLTDDNFDPSLNWQDIKDSLKLYTNLNSILSDEELKTKKDHAIVDNIVGTAKRLEGIMLKIATNVISDNLAKQQILGQNGIMSPEDALQPQAETSMWTRFWLGVSKSENPLVASVYKMVTKALEKSRQDSYTLKNKIKEVIDKHNLKSSDFERMLQIDDEGNKTGNLVAPVKYSYWVEFNKALRNNNDEWFTKNTIKDEEKYKTSKKNYEEVLKGRKKYDIVEIIGNLNKSDKYKDRTQDELLLIADNIWEKSYKEKVSLWEERNKNNNKFRKPKMEIWADSKYLEIQADPRLKEFYDLYTKTVDDVSEFLPMKEVRSNFIPNFTKQFVEKAMDIGFLEAVKQLPKEASESLQFTMDEKEYGLRNPITGERVNEIPVLGTQEMSFFNKEERREFMDKRKSYDLGQVLYTFIDSAYRYRELKEVENTALITLERIKETQAVEVVMPDGTKKMKADNTNTYNHLKDYLDTVFYGRAKEEGTGIEIAGKRYGVDKAFDKVIAYTSLKNLGLNLFAPVVDHLGNITNASFAAITGKYYSTKNFGKGYKYATLGNGGITENDKKAKLLMEKFDIVTGFFGREYAKELTAYKSKKIFDSSHFYSLYKVSEFALQNSVMMAMLLEGKYGVSFEDYIVKDEELVWNNPNKPEPTTEEIAVFRQKVLHVIKNITGNLDPNDKAAINRNIMGRLLMQHRNWIPRQFESRWGAKKYDYVLETWMEGRYRTLLREGFSILRGKKKFSELSEMERSNLKGVMLELAVITTLIGLVAALKSDDGDDDDTWFERYITRIADRLVSELTFFVSLDSAMEILKSPMATSGTLEDGKKWFEEVWKASTGEKHKLGKKSRRFIIGWGRLEYFYDYINGDVKK